MDTITGYKDRAIASLSGKWGSAAIATIIYMVVVGVPMGVLNVLVTDGVGSFWALLLLPLIWGYYIMWLSVARGGTVDYGMLFDGFKDYKRIFITMLLVGIYEFLWSLLLLIPGIVKSYSYSMTYYILADEPEMKYDAAIEKSMRLMKGHKFDLFMLDLSFIGWAILCLLTLGIGVIFLAPYVETAHAKFYEDLIAENAE